MGMLFWISRKETAGVGLCHRGKRTDGNSPAMPLACGQPLATYAWASEAPLVTWSCFKLHCGVTEWFLKAVCSSFQGEKS